MTKQSILTKSKIKTLITLYVQYKKAQADFTEAKKVLTGNLACGKYESVYGNVIKVESIRRTLDIDRLLFEHPEIDPEQYKTSKTVETVTIQNFNLA